MCPGFERGYDMRGFQSVVSNLDEAEVAEARHDLDAVSLGQLLNGAAELSTLQVGGQPPDFVPVGGHFRSVNLLTYLNLIFIGVLLFSILTGFARALKQAALLCTAAAVAFPAPRYKCYSACPLRVAVIQLTEIEPVSIVFIYTTFDIDLFYVLSLLSSSLPPNSL